MSVGGIIVFTIIGTVAVILFLAWLVDGEDEDIQLSKYRKLSVKLREEQQDRNTLLVMIDTTDDLDNKEYAERCLKISNKEIENMKAELARLDSQLGLS